MAELPYPSRALLPAIVQVLRAHLEWDFISFGWDERTTLKPLAYWAAPIVGEILQAYVENFGKFAEEVPLQAMLDSNGHLLRQAETLPEYEQSSLYRHLLAPYGVRWGMSVPIYLGESEVGFFGVFRRSALGPYADADQERLDRVALALGDLDRQHNPLAALPGPGSHEGVIATVLVGRGGHIQALSRNARNILFLARREGMGPPDWARADQQALPPEVAACVNGLFSHEDRAIDEVKLRLPWGGFDFFLEKMELVGEQSRTVVNIIIRHHEPLDIAVARGLWGWALSPQEKRIIIASTRNPSRSELAAVLGLSEGTLRHYINVLQNRLGVSSRQEIIDRVLAASPRLPSH